MNIIIVGAGEVGRHLAESLSSRLHNIILIEQSEALADELNELLDIHILCGNGASVTTLAEANTAECDLFLALSSDDNTNLVSASLAKSMGAKKAIARVHGALQREEWLFDYKAHFKIDYLFSSERLAAVELAKFVRNPECLLVEEIARGRVELLQVQLSAISPAAGKTLREISLPTRVRVASIQRNGLQIIPRANDQLLAGDLVTLFGDPNRLPEVRSLLNPESQQNRQFNVVIFGGGETGCALAQMLESGNYRVRIMELDPKKCRELSEILQNTVVINGDATSLQQLREEQVGDADFFIATSRDDEDNVMTCLQAKSLGTKYTLALIHRADYANVISRNSTQLGIMGAVSPRVATSRDLMRFITSEKFHVVLTLAGGSEVLELTVSEQSSTVGKKVSKIPWPEGSGLVAMLRGQEAMVPSAEDTILAGDTVYAMVSPSARKPMVKMLTDQ
ncbi:MAG TPA: Trk system potassium transporter TrkA [Verrucomicrobiae bacterium]